ncbi:MAG TPA: DUF1223 domain-containing protein [Verrucomicrobiae bacterium]|jgi:hypothetical protein|nr:DUF1223 domain-containing protein [Verrucomicrobiae bacterium]
MVRKLGLFLILGMILSCAREAAAGDVRVINGPNRAALVELFSSEGCATCPQADAWFSGLVPSKGLWKDYVPLVFHVTYWDDLGWKDVLAKPAYTDRQRAYAAAWGQPNVYTPGVALNGKEWRHWPSVQAPPAASGKGGTLSATSTDGLVFHVRYDPAARIWYTARVFGALLGFGIEHDVDSGENTGKRLKHDFVVLDLKAADLKLVSGGFEADLHFKAPAEMPAKTGVAFWVLEGESLEPLQAAGGFAS